MKANKTLITGAAVGAVAGAYIATHKDEIKDKVKGAIKTITDAGVSKLMKGKAAVDDAMKEVVSHAKHVAKKTTKAVK